jgi:hypothetical protein
MSHFTVMVIGDDPEQQLAPYHEFECTGVDNQYVQDIDITAQVVERVSGGESLHDALEYFGLNDRTVPSMDNLNADHKYGYAIVSSNGLVKAVNRTNPNAKWDWYQLGGRWMGTFKLYPGCSGWLGNPGVYDNKAASGWVDSARKRDIDFESMRLAAAEKAGKEYDKMIGIVGSLDGFIPWDVVLEKHGKDNIEVARTEYNDQPAKVALQASKEWHVNLENFMCSRDDYVQIARDMACVTFAVIKDGQWYERGSMGAWAVVSDEKDQGEWLQQFNALLDAIPDDTLLSVYDCHI